MNSHLLLKKSSVALLKYELDLINSGIDLIAGVDEVGRGALAGPMVVAAAILNPEHIRNYDVVSADLQEYLAVKDSKLISAKKRILLSKFLQNVLICYSIIELQNTQIDKEGIATCTQIGFFESIKKLKVKPDHVLTDTFEIKSLTISHQTNIISGDNKSISIAAASIVAKVYRDNLMINFHNEEEKYSVYGFDKHKGYGTKLHKEMIKKFGLSDLHRKSFKLTGW